MVPVGDEIVDQLHVYAIGGDYQIRPGCRLHDDLQRALNAAVPDSLRCCWFIESIGSPGKPERYGALLDELDQPGQRTQQQPPLRRTRFHHDVAVGMWIRNGPSTAADEGLADGDPAARLLAPVEPMVRVCSVRWNPLLDSMSRFSEDRAAIGHGRVGTQFKDARG